MGYDISLIDENENPVKVALHESGGTYPIGGTTSASINITYNYAVFFREALDETEGIRWLYGRSGEESVPRLHAAVRELGTNISDDYWEATPGNAGHVLEILLRWARRYPTAVFKGD